LPLIPPTKAAEEVVVATTTIEDDDSDRPFKRCDVTPEWLEFEDLSAALTEAQRTRGEKLDAVVSGTIRCAIFVTPSLV
jgi:hypothetical protein